MVASRHDESCCHLAHVERGWFGEPAAAGGPGPGGELALTVSGSALNRWLDGLPRAQVRLGDEVVHTWRLSATVGVVLAFCTATFVAGIAREPVAPVIAAGAASLALYFGVILAKWKASGSTPHVLYEGLVAGLAASVAVNVLIGDTAPLRALDIQVTGLAVLFLFGRLGCFLGCCCWGVISDLGVRYPLECHKGRAPGRRFPVQLVEAAAWAALVPMAAGLTWWAPPGMAAGAVLFIYAIVRALLERLRADPRPHWHGVSFSTWASAPALLGGIGLMSASVPISDTTRAMALIVAISAALTIAIRRWVGSRSLPTEEMTLLGRAVGVAGMRAEVSTWLVAGTRVWAHRRENVLTISIRGVREPISRAVASILVERFLQGMAVTVHDPPLQTTPDGTHRIRIQMLIRGKKLARRVAQSQGGNHVQV